VATTVHWVEDYEQYELFQIASGYLTAKPYWEHSSGSFFDSVEEA
jgi:hypothetical protein